MFIYPDIDPIAFGLGPLQVRWYGLMYLGGFLLGWLGVRSRARRPDSPMSPALVDDLVFYVALGVIFGGRVGYVLFYNLGSFLDNPLNLFKVWEGGMSFHGGLLGVLIAMGVFARRVGQPYFAVTDFIATWVTPGLGLGRIGNFINGELWGAETSPDAFWSVVVNGVPRHASQLYEAFLEGFVLFLILWAFSLRSRPIKAVSGLFLIFYGTFRVAIEFVRLPDTHLNEAADGYLAFGWLTMGQLLSTPMILAGIVLFWLAYKENAFVERKAE
ncbi:MAG: prolipoprotein diacylglyceryl transferase [Candidatus Rariloculaceae bacterium]